jgi:O-antigen/teichoic acid export membrane protein
MTDDGHRRPDPPSATGSSALDDTADPAGSLARGGVVLAVAAVVSNLVAYLFTVVLTRSFDPAAYGALGSLLGAGLVGVVPSTAMQYVVARRTAVGRLGRAENDQAGLRLAAWVGAGVFGVAVLLSPAAGPFLHLGDPWPVVWLGAALLPQTVQGALLGGLLGHERYVAFGGIQVLTAVLRLAGALVGVQLGLSVAGVLTAMAVANGLSCAAAWWLSGPASWRRGGARQADLLGDLLRSCSAMAGVVVLSNVDVLLARHYLPRVDSGAYALASLFAKACLWGAQFVPMLVFPRLARHAGRGLMLRSVAAVTAVGGAGILVTVLAGAPLVHLVTGSKPEYEPVIGLTPGFAALGAMWALVQLALLAAVARGDPRPGRMLWALVVVEAAVIAVGPHRTIGQLLAVSAAVAAILMLCTVLLDLRAVARRHADAAGGVAATAPSAAPAVAAD